MEYLNVDQLSDVNCSQDIQDASGDSALGGNGLLTKLAIIIATEDESRREKDVKLNGC
jgi:hypothetical protein